MKSPFSLFTFLLFTWATAFAGAPPKLTVTTNASGTLTQPVAATFLGANGIVPTTRTINTKPLNANISLNLSDLGGVLTNAQTPNVVNVDNLLTNGDFIVTSNAFGASSTGMLDINSAGIVSLGDPTDAVRGGSIVIDNTSGHGTVAITGNGFTYNGTNVLLDGDDINIGNINGTTGSALLMSNGSGGVGNVTLGTGLSFTGTTLNAASSFNPAIPGAIGGTTPSTSAFTTVTLTPANDTTGLTLTGGSITGSGTTPFGTITGTWNTSGTVDGVKISVTNTASNAASRYLQVNGGTAGTTEKFAVSDTDVYFHGGFSIEGYNNAAFFISPTNGVQGVIGGLGLEIFGGGINARSSQFGPYTTISHDATNGHVTTTAGDLVLGPFSGNVTITSVAKLTPTTTPGSPAEGMIYVNSSDHHVYEYNGTAWKQLDN